jgi:hypothetical protein
MLKVLLRDIIEPCLIRIKENRKKLKLNGIKETKILLAKESVNKNQLPNNGFMNIS